MRLSDDQKASVLVLTCVALGLLTVVIGNYNAEMKAERQRETGVRVFHEHPTIQALLKE